MENAFYDFWRLYDPQPEYRNRYRACERVWTEMDALRRRRILYRLQTERASPCGAGPHTANPYFYLIRADPQPEWLTPAQKATAASFFRHISEAFLPTYPAILTALTLTGIAAGPYVLAMLPLMILMVLIGCFFLYRGRIPFRAEGEPSTHKLRNVLDFFLGLWPLITAIILVVGFGMNVLLSIVISIAAYFLLGRFPAATVRPYFKSSFQLKLLANTFSIYVFKGALTASGVVGELPSFFEGLPIPAFLIFGLLCFLGTVIAGSQAITTTMVPVAFAAIPGAGLPLLCLLMCFIYAAMQISPTHVCLSLSCDHFGASLGDLIRLTLPIITTFLVIVSLLYAGWMMLL